MQRGALPESPRDDPGKRLRVRDSARARAVDPYVMSDARPPLLQQSDNHQVQARPSPVQAALVLPELIRISGRLAEILRSEAPSASGPVCLAPPLSADGIRGVEDALVALRDILRSAPGPVRQGVETPEVLDGIACTVAAALGRLSDEPVLLNVGLEALKEIVKLDNAFARVMELKAKLLGGPVGVAVRAVVCSPRSLELAFANAAGEAVEVLRYLTLILPEHRENQGKSGGERNAAQAAEKLSSAAKTVFSRADIAGVIRVRFKKTQA